MGFIDRPQQVWWRKAVFQVHFYVGIFLALYVIVISISGCVLIFAPEIIDDTPSIPRQALNAKPLPLGSLAAIARKLHPDYRTRTIVDGSWRDRASRILMEKHIPAKGLKSLSRRDVYLNPFTGRLLIDRNFNPLKSHPIYRFIDDFHENLLAGRTGLHVNAICAALLLLLCMTGIVIWWPGRKNWTQGLSVKRKTNWKRVNFDTHRALGFWALLMISIWAATGVYFGYAWPIHKAMERVIPFVKYTAYPKTNWKPGDPMLSIDELYRRAQQAMPKEHIDAIGFPATSSGSVSVSYISSRSPQYLHTELVLLDPITGKVTYIRNSWKDSKAGDIFLGSLLMLHLVSFESIPLKVLFTLLGLCPIVLVITGALMWWNRILSKRWRAIQQKSRQQVSPRVPLKRAASS